MAATIKEAGEVKTAEKLTTSQVNIQSLEVVQQIMSQMKVRIKSGASSMRLQLNPKELGGIEVQMIRNTEGVSVTFFAEHASTGHLLETQMNQLRQSLKDAGVQLTGLNISQQNQPKQEGGFFKQRPFLGQYFQDDSPQIEIANKDGEHRERIGGSLNEIDYLI
jgi:flagellar hook-length control protein FliK